jgi:hypothetical protein
VRRDTTRQKMSEAQKGRTVPGEIKASPRPAHARQEMSRQGRNAYRVFKADCSDIEQAASEGGDASPLMGFDYNTKRRIIRNILRKGIK